MKKELKCVYKRSSLEQEAAQAKAEEASHLKAVVDKLHGVLTKTCNLEGYICSASFTLLIKYSFHAEENRDLKNEITSMKASAVELEKTHSCQMAEAIENLQSLADTHHTKLAAVQEAAELKCENFNNITKFTLNINNSETRIRSQREGTSRKGG